MSIRLVRAEKWNLRTCWWNIKSLRNKTASSLKLEKRTLFPPAEVEDRKRIWPRSTYKNELGLTTAQTRHLTSENCQHTLFNKKGFCWCRYCCCCSSFFSLPVFRSKYEGNICEGDNLQGIASYQTLYNVNTGGFVDIMDGHQLVINPQTMDTDHHYDSAKCHGALDTVHCDYFHACFVHGISTEKSQNIKRERDCAK